MAMDLKKFEALVKMFAPMIVAAVVPNGEELAPLITEAIVAQEVLSGPGSGAAKRAAVVKAAATAAKIANTAKGVTVLDPMVTAAQAGAVCDLTISFIKSIHEAQAAVHPPTV